VSLTSPVWSPLPWSPRQISLARNVRKRDGSLGGQRPREPFARAYVAKLCPSLFTTYSTNVLFRRARTLIVRIRRDHCKVALQSLSLHDKDQRMSKGPLCLITFTRPDRLIRQTLDRVVKKRSLEQCNRDRKEKVKVTCSTLDKDINGLGPWLTRLHVCCSWTRTKANQAPSLHLSFGFLAR
jgi:hypothetical protein